MSDRPPKSFSTRAKNGSDYTMSIAGSLDSEEEYPQDEDDAHCHLFMTRGPPSDNYITQQYSKRHDRLEEFILGDPGTGSARVAYGPERNNEALRSVDEVFPSSADPYMWQQRQEYMPRSTWSTSGLNPPYDELNGDDDVRSSTNDGFYDQDGYEDGRYDDELRDGQEEEPEVENRSSKNDQMRSSHERKGEKAALKKKRKQREEKGSDRRSPKGGSKRK